MQRGRIMDACTDIVLLGDTSRLQLAPRLLEGRGAPLVCYLSAVREVAAQRKSAMPTVLPRLNHRSC